MRRARVKRFERPRSLPFPLRIILLLLADATRPMHSVKVNVLHTRMPRAMYLAADTLPIAAGVSKGLPN